MSIFEEVKNQLNIRQVIEHYGIQVDRHGKFKCVFHNDHNPSASIKKDYFNCFVCGAGGDLITFTAKYLGISNYEACKALISDFGLNIDIINNKERKAQYRAAQALKNDIKHCNSFKDKYAKSEEARAYIPRKYNYELRNDIKQIDARKEHENEEYTKHVWRVLSDMHRMLWQDTQLYPFDDERHIKGLQELTIVEYYIDLYDNDAVEFIKNCKGVIEHYERELDIRNKS